jgi:poly-gamma-glutamate capsule biosynthesis protein CapA/YwtB (metallophosphatase superfamily)
MYALVRKADVAFTNFETLIHDFRIPGAAQSGGTYMGSPAFVTEELEWAGFDILSTATNHTGDYGPEGLRRTREALDRSKLVYAGVGDNLALARSPAYFDSKAGRVALISVCSTFPEASMAGPQRKDMPGRPGLNPLRVEVTYTIEPQTYALFRGLAGPNAEHNGPQGASLRYLNATFKSGDAPAVQVELNKTDLAEISASVQDARKQADWVILSVHSHETQSWEKRELPPDFLVAFARGMVDAGADIVVGHGPHFLKGVEVYKGRPILYSLGNFIFENDLVHLQPQENFERQGLPSEALPGDYYDKRSKSGSLSFASNPLVWDSAIAELALDPEKGLRSLRFHPIVLGYGKPRAQRGRPVPACGDDAARILGRLQALSAPLGTKIRVENDIGVLELN